MKALNALQINIKNQAFTIILPFYKSGNAMWHRLLLDIDVSKVNFLNCPVTPIIVYSSFRSLLTLDYFPDIACLKNPFSEMISCISQTN